MNSEYLNSFGKFTGVFNYCVLFRPSRLVKNVAHCLENITAAYAICLIKIRSSIIVRIVEFVGTVYNMS